jgi:ftsk gamma domain protein
MNVSKSGTSWSIGPRGAKVNFGKRGTYVTTGIPGTGIYSRTKVCNNNMSNHRTQLNNADSGYEIKNYTGCLFSFICYALAVILPICGIHFALSILLIIIGFALHLSSVEKKETVQMDNEIGNDNETLITETPINRIITDTEEKVDTKKEEIFIKKEEEEKIEDPSVNNVNMIRLDPLFEDSARLVVIHQQGSTSLIQRKFAIGYNRAGRIMDQLECAGIVGETSGIKAREVLCKDEGELEYRLNHLEKSRFETLKQKQEKEFKEIAQQEVLNENSRLIKLGIDLEKEGMINEAIAVYEKAIIPQLPATHPYDRLMILYRKKKDYDNEIRIIKIAISVFMKENERRAGRAIEDDSSLYNQVMQALETNENIRYEDGKWAFVQYDVMEYITRLEKAKRLLEKSKN